MKSASYIVRSSQWGRWIGIALLLVQIGFWQLGRPVRRVHAADEKPRIWLTPPVRQNTVFKGDLPARSEAVSIVSDDFDADGIADLAVGYRTGSTGRIAFFKGNLDAFAPQSDASWRAIGRGDFPSPFLSEARVVNVPDQPDFLAAGDFIGHDGPGLVAAARGGNKIHVLQPAPGADAQLLQSVDAGGAITAMAAERLQNGKYTQLAVGVRTATGPTLAIFTGSDAGLTQISSIGLSADASQFVFGDLDGDGMPDVLIVAGGRVSILQSGSQSISQVEVPYEVASAVVGDFLYDRNSRRQIGLLAKDGSLHVLAHEALDSRPFTIEEFRALRRANFERQRANLTAAVRPPIHPPVGPVRWKEMEAFAQVGIPDQSGVAPLMFRTRISSNGADDVLFLSAARVSLMMHTDQNPASGVVIDRSDLGADAVAAIPARVNVDGRPGLVLLRRGDPIPHVMMPLPDPTFFPNRFDDITPRGTGVTCLNTTGVDASNDCTLREAIIKANATAGTDTIMLQAGTYTLSLARNAADHHTSLQGTLEVQDSLNIIGAGQNTTIIQGGTTLTNSVDKVISFNQDIDSFTNATVSVSNLTIQNGNNRGDCCATQDGFGGAFDFDTGNPGTATLTMTNVTLQNNKVNNGQGGGFTIFNTKNSTGFATFSGMLIQNNVSVPNSTGCCGDGGGGVIDARSKMVMSSSQIINNQAQSNAGTNATGGGLFLSGQHTQPQSMIHSTTISGNTAAGVGGGISSIATLLIDQGSVISGNTAGHDSNNAGGGGIVNNSADGLTLTKVTVTGNTTTGNGGALYTGNNSGGNPVTISFSRLAGNTAVTGTNIFNFTASQTGNTGDQVTATNNWWGTNAAASTISTASTTCPAVAPNNSVCFDPFIVLTHTASPQKIKISQSTTLTGDMSKDNHGNGAALSGNLDEIVGLPITFDTPVLGTIPQTQPETLGNPVPTATATFNAGSTAGLGSAHATVDQAVVSANSNLIASASESGTTATITTVGAHGFTTSEFVTIAGMTGAGCTGYNGNFFPILSTTTTTFTYTAPSGLSNSCAVSGSTTASVGIVILQPPSISKSFNPTTVPTNSPSTITFSITNGNVIPINASFTDSLPANLVVATTPNVVNNCSGSVGATAAATSITFSNSSFAAGTCTVKVDVQSATDNTYSNSVTIDSTDAGNGNTSSANLTVINPPTSAKAFNPTQIPLNGTSTLTITLSSSNTNLTLNGVAFTDNFPAGVQVAAVPNASTTCGVTFNPSAGDTSVGVSGVSLAPQGSCTVTVSVTGTTAGAKNNSVQASSTNGGSGNTAHATLTVVAPPSIAKSFTPTSIALNATSSLQFTITNPNSGTALTGVAFSDTLPTGLTVATNSGTVCGGTVTTTNPTSISLTGATIAASGQCQFSVTVTGATAGSYTNTTGAVTSTEGGTGGTASANLTVVAPPSIAKAFNPNSITLNNTTSLQFTITNPNASIALTGVAFSDTLPTGLTVTSGTSTVCSGTLTLTNPTGILLTGATVAGGGQCQFSVTVTGASAGQYTNTTGSVSSTNGGTGNTASANLTVNAADLTIGMTHAGNFSQGQVGDTFTITVTNLGPNPTDGSTITVSDVIPSGLTVTGASGTGWSCTLAVSCTRNDVLANGGSYPPITIAVNVNSNAPASITNTATVSGGGDGNPSNNTASNTISIGQTSQATLTGAITGKTGATSARVWTIAVTNHDTNPANSTQITGLTLLQTLGSACTPVINTTFPVAVGTIAPSGTASGNVTIDFSSCATGARFKVTATFGANSGANGGTMVVSNQLP